MLYVFVRHVIDVFCIVTRGAIGAREKYEKYAYGVCLCLVCILW